MTHEEKKHTVIEITSVVTKDQAAKFVEAIEGESYMKFHVLLCPAGGSFSVSVETTYDGTLEEIQGMLNFLMFCAITRGKEDTKYQEYLQHEIEYQKYLRGEIPDPRD